MHSALSNARHPGEDFKTYRARLKAVALQLKAYLKGQFAHVSSQIVHLPMIANEANLQFDEAIKRGLYRDVVRYTTATGEIMRVGRTKGATYRRPLREIKP